MSKSLKEKNKKGIALWNRAKKVIPGGSQLLSKRSEMYLPDLWPSYAQRAKGCEVWDMDGNHYIDMTFMGIGTGILGYADPDVNRAVKRAIDQGSMTTLNSPEEVELAELLIKLHPWAHNRGMVRFTRSGGEAMAVAVRIARAASGKEKIAFCGYHGWSDWYLAANLAEKKALDGHLLPGLKPTGVPRGLRGTILPFSYNKIKELEVLIKKYRDIGVIVVETVRHDEPKNNFLKKICAIANKIGAVLVFDEITVGWRLTIGGAHLIYGVNPDIAVYAKAISNGFPMGTIVGRHEVMQAAQETFISSTYWTERIGFVAALATIKKLKAHNVPRHIKKIGGMIGDGWKRLAKKHGINLTVLGPESLVTFSLNYGKESQAIRTLFTQEMLKRGFLANVSVYVSYAHKEYHVRACLKAVDEVFALLKKAINTKSVHILLEGPIAHIGFKRLT